MPRRVVQTDLPAQVDEAVPDHVDEPAADADEADPATPTSGDR